MFFSEAVRTFFLAFVALGACLVDFDRFWTIEKRHDESNRLLASCANDNSFFAMSGWLLAAGKHGGMKISDIQSARP